MCALVFVAFALVVSTAVSDARVKRSAKKVATATLERRPEKKSPKAEHEVAKAEKRAKPKSRGQSFGAPWSGRLVNATKFRAPDRTYLRRPHRAFATRTTAQHTRQAIRDTLKSFPKAHALAIGDFSAAQGGWISDHNSHQSGRDVDLGLFFKVAPAGYPASFIDADATTMHTAAMWSLIRNLANTADEDGGVQMMFLDFELQGVIYKWAKQNGVSKARLDKVFQYPHGRGAAAGIVRHEPNHADHVHVRFRCAAAETSCR